MSDVGWRSEAQHDPSAGLRDYVLLRDRQCDGPTGSSTPAHRCDLDHTRPHPEGPTAAWNLAARNRRTHQLKHYGWTPIRTRTSTVWSSPAGQLVEVPRQTTRPPHVDPVGGAPACLPSAGQLAETDAHQLTAPTDDDRPPWPEPVVQQGSTQWTWLDQPLSRQDEPVPF
jgi:hypothetical protein